MKRLIPGVVFALLLVFAFAAPAVAAVAPISQEPDTSGMGYLAGSSLELSWTSYELPETARLTLYLASSTGPGSLNSEIVASDLDQTGSTSVTIPSTGGPYFYYLDSQVDIGGGTTQVYRSNAYSAWQDGYGWWFTLETLPTISLQPYGQWVPEGYTATFEADAAGVPTPSCQWQVDDGSGWMDITGATEGSYTTPETSAEMNGWRYRAVFTNERGSVTSDEVTLNVESPTITQLPATAGKTYFAGSLLKISWESESLDPDAKLTLYRAQTVGDSLDSVAVAMDLPQSGSTTVTIPTESGSYFYYLYTSWNVAENVSRSVYSDQYYAWFTVVQPQAVTISAPAVTPGTPKPKRDASFEATVSPAAASDQLTFTLHLLCWETRRVGGRRVTDWYEYPSITLSAADVSLGRISGTGKLPTRGEWKMYVTSAAAPGYAAGTSGETLFTAR